MNIILKQANARTVKFPSPAKLVYADPPTNHGMNEAASNDQLTDLEYQHFALDWLSNATLGMRDNARLIVCLCHTLRTLYERLITHNFSFLRYESEIIWSYGFGLYTTRRVVPCHDNILVFKTGRPAYNWEAVAVESQRQRAGDRRADSRGRNLSSVWDIPRVPGNSFDRKFLRGARRSCQPLELCKRIILLYTNEGDVVHDMFVGSGTMAKTCQRYKRDYWGVDISHTYIDEAQERLNDIPL